MKTFEPLYARDSSGRINAWEVSAEDRKSGAAAIVIVEGLLQGKQTKSDRIISKGKNLGKMNATTAYEQAEKEALSRWEKKKKQGYKSLTDLGIDHMAALAVNFPNILDKELPQNRTDANNISKPMKAQPYFKDSGEVRISFPCYGQPKLNGFRVMARWETVKEGIGMFATEVEKVVFRSKEGLRYDILDHIEAEFTKGMFFHTDLDGNTIELAYDGEMYIHNEILSEISSAVRKKNPKTLKLVFHIFDVAVDKLSQKERVNLLQTLGVTFDKSRAVKVITSSIIKSNEEAQTATDHWIKSGYEGGIFRDMKALYQFGKRPQTMVKLKRSEDKEFKIIDVIGGNNAPDEGVFVCLAENGKEFKATPEGTKETKREYLLNKHLYIGKLLTVRFFERTVEGKPFHATGVTIRDYE